MTSLIWVVCVPVCRGWSSDDIRCCRWSQ